MQESQHGNYANRDDLDRLVALLPDLYYASNRLLENCIGPELTKKNGVVLWLVAESGTTDELGPYLLHDEIVERVAEWFVLTKEHARSEVSRAKAKLMGAGYIFVGGGSKNVHLTDKGKVQVDQMRSSARLVMESALKVLSQTEQQQLLNSVFRLTTRRKPPARADREPARVQPKGPASEGRRDDLKSTRLKEG